ncbi:TlpA family protein disulfide reductase [Cutibacterium sp. WCA-380-WT-3A]|uniref:TlpA family protein disulfide reductase n=1 Tax=Cutibacterium porci TaxID=2605781 RepID=A0A7K0J507_9ACTN|nr:TlpA disulfide reductase family protein [Cutibacterium porci]MSS45014.1 TlpA family protein disulfide reductase [Cutibacterium porci]
MKIRLIAMIAVATLMVTGVSACSSTSASDDKGFATGDGSWSKLPVEKREPAAVLTGNDLNGKTISTDDAKGKVIVVNVWGSWCAPCRHEAPALAKAADSTKTVAAFYGINTRDLDPGPPQAFSRAFHVPYPSFYDPDGQMLLKFTELPPKAIPSTLVIDRKGRSAARFVGEVSTATLVQAINDVAKESQ